ncbi:MAG: hypothetical protein ABI716_01645 [Candidatus Saccharibacteria bacterium]
MGILHKKTSDQPHRRQSAGGSVRQPLADSQRQNIFQRNRTLTGSTSNYLSETHHQTDLKSPRTHVHHLALRRRKVGMVLMIVLGGALLLLWLLSQFTASVIISVSDSSVSRPINSALYQKAIEDYLGMNPISRLRFAMDNTSLSAYLTQTLPEIDSLQQTSFGGIGATDFTITVRKPVAGWELDSKHYFVDAKGVAFERNYYANPSVQIVDDSGASLQQGTTVASNRFLGFVGRIVALSKVGGYTVTQATLPAGTTRQLEIRLKDVAPIVRLSIDRPAGEQVEDMGRTLNFFASRGQAPQYVDVRVRGKAFYK